MHFVACETVREHNRKIKKTRKLYLEGKKHIQRDQQVQQEPTEDQAGPSTPTANQAEPSRQQAPTQGPTNSQNRRTERKQKKASP